LGIRLDWQVEAERAYQRAGEDPQEKWRRRAQRIRILLFSVGVTICVCIVGAIVWLRLYTVDSKLRQDLITTVQAETAALRINDLGGFLAIQRTAPGGGWYEEQTARFKRYQDLKSQGNLKLTGNVLDVAIDGSRGRALVEEVIDGVSYRAVWFYWRYNDGWRHVPSDYTFWGEEHTISGKVATVRYNQLDALLAQALASRIDRWWADGCGYLSCQDMPKLAVRIEADPISTVRWDGDKPYTLIIPSPLAIDDRARADVPLPQTLEETIAAQIADRQFDIATGNLRPVATADAAWIRQATIEWLATVYAGRSAPNTFIQSLKEHYGPASLSGLVHALRPTSDISVVSAALRLPLETLALDWRLFFQWRLDVEKTLLSRNDLNGFQALWDTANPQAVQQMRDRMTRPTQATPQVQAVAINSGADGVPRATVQVAADGKSQVLTFRLVNGSWRRSAG
jgi:hypothetical protein